MTETTGAVVGLNEKTDEKGSQTIHKKSRDEQEREREGDKHNHEEKGKETRRVRCSHATGLRTRFTALFSLQWTSRGKNKGQGCNRLTTFQARKDKGCLREQGFQIDLTYVLDEQKQRMPGHHNGQDRILLDSVGLVHCNPEAASLSDPLKR